MLYVLTDQLATRSWWRVLTLRYLKALHTAGKDFRVVWRKGHLFRDDIDPEFDFLFEGKPGASYTRDVVSWRPKPWARGIAGKAAKAIGVDTMQRYVERVTESTTVSYFGGSAEPGECTLYIGNVPGAVESIADELNRGPKNIALIEWAWDTMSRHIVDGLNRYDAVFIPYNAVHLLNAGVDRAVSIPEVSPLVAPFKRPGGPPIAYAIGTWREPDCVGLSFAKFCEACVGIGRRDVVLHLVCPDAPFKTPREAADHLMLDITDLPTISVDAQGLLASSAEWADLHRSGEIYLSCSQRADTDPWLVDASMHGNDVWMRHQKWETSLEDHLEGGWDKPPSKVFSYGYDFVGKELVRLIANVEPRKAKPTVSTTQPRVSIAFVIPHRDRGLAWINATLDTLAPQLESGDEVIISDQESVHLLRALKELCLGEGLSLVSSTSEKWSIAKARNAGVKAAKVLGVDAVMFLDCDILLPPDFVAALRLELADSSAVVIPDVISGQDFYIGDMVHAWLSSGDHAPTRIGSGLAAMRLDVLELAGGYDESFVGHGGEDIEFLHRAKELCGTVEVRGCLPLVYHQPHVISSADDANEERVKRLLRGEEERGVVNPEGWGAFEWIVKQGEVADE